MMPEVLRIDLAQRWLLTDTDEILPILHMFDSDEEETDEPGLVRAVVAGNDAFGYLTIEVHPEVDDPTVH